MHFILVKTLLYKKRIDLLPINFSDDVSNVRFSLIADIRPDTVRFLPRANIMRERHVQKQNRKIY